MLASLLELIMVSSDIFFNFLFFIFRYEVNFQNGIDCGGAYVKLLSKTPDLDLVSSVIPVDLTSFIACLPLK